MFSKQDALQTAVEIAKEAAKGGTHSPVVVLEDSYNKLVELMQKANQ